jgi:hypothetical protein
MTINEVRLSSRAINALTASLMVTAWTSSIPEWRRLQQSAP